MFSNDVYLWYKPFSANLHNFTLWTEKYRRDVYFCVNFLNILLIMWLLLVCLGMASLRCDLPFGVFHSSELLFRFLFTSVHIILNQSRHGHRWILITQSLQWLCEETLRQSVRHPVQQLQHKYGCSHPFRSSFRPSHPSRLIS